MITEFAKEIGVIAAIATSIAVITKLALTGFRSTYRCIKTAEKMYVTISQVEVLLNEQLMTNNGGSTVLDKLDDVQRKSHETARYVKSIDRRVTKLEKNIQK